MISSVCFGQASGSTGGTNVTNYNNGLISTSDRYNSSASKGYVSYEEVLEEYNGIDGSPFLHNGEILVDLIFCTDTIFKDITIKYDQYNNEILAKKDGKFIVLDQKFYKGFIYQNGKKEETYLLLEGNGLSFHKVLFQADDFIFFKTNRTTLEKVDRHVMGLETNPKKFVQRPDYYVIKNKETFYVKLRNGEAMTHFPEAYASQVPGLKKRLRVKKLRKEKDYMKIINAFSIPAAENTDK